MILHNLARSWRCRWVKKALPLYLFIFLPYSAAAQVGEYRTDLAVGVNGGYMISTIAFVPEIPQKQFGGMTGGVTLRYTCEKYFNSICSIVAELNYAQSGWQEDIFDKNNQPVYYPDDKEKQHPLFYERRINYLQIPFLARMGWGRERKGLQFFVQLGPQIGFYLNESSKTNVVPRKGTLIPRSSNVVAQDTMAVENKFDYGIAVGAGVEFSHPRLGHLLLEGRYYYGLGNIYGNSKADVFGRSNFGQIVIKATYLCDIIKTRNSKIK